MPDLTTAAFVLLLLSAAWADLRSRRIPNVLTLGGLVVGLGLRLTDGSAAFFNGLEGAGLALLVTLPFFLLGGLGGGDSKLLIAVGAFMGPGLLIGALLLISLLGGVIAAADAARKGVLVPAVLGCVEILRQWGSVRRLAERRTIASVGALTVPYGVAIAAGSLAWWFWGGPLL